MKPFTIRNHWIHSCERRLLHKRRPEGKRLFYSINHNVSIAVSTGGKSFIRKSSAQSTFANQKPLSRREITSCGSSALVVGHWMSHQILPFCTVSSCIGLLVISTWLISIFTDYRVCEFGGDDCIKTPSVEDRTAHKYNTRLVERVGAVYEYLRDPCKLSEISPVPTRPPTTRKKILRIGKLASNPSGNNITISKLMEQHDVKIKKIVFP